MKNILIDKIRNKDASIGVIGLGYVGIPLIKRFVDEKFNVIGFDNDTKKIKLLKKSSSYIKHISDDTIKSIISKKFTATSNYKAIKDVDIIIICVPTPLKNNKTPDLSYIKSSIISILPYVRKGQTIALESTTYPGTTDEEILIPIQKKNLTPGKDFFIVYSPEREDPGNINYYTKNTPKIVGGYSKNCLAVGEAIYNSIIDKVIPVSSTKTAEMVKLLENIYRAVNVGLVNEMKIVADKMKIDIHEVIAAAATKPFGFNAFYPGPGLGGHCIPIDPFYLTWKAKEYGVDTKFIQLAGKINSDMPKWVIKKVNSALKIINVKPKDSKILILGLAYKKNIDDFRESPAVEILKLIKRKVKKIDYSDPYIPEFKLSDKNKIILKSRKLKKGLISSYDLILLCTDHDEFPYKLIRENAKVIVDTRNVYRNSYKNVIKA